MASIATSVAWVLIVIGLPETLYVRGLAHVPPTGKYRRLRITGTKAAGRHLQLADFARPFQMCVLSLLSTRLLAGFVLRNICRLRFFPVVVVAWFAGAFGLAIRYCC
jgi:hypothetical protein